MNRIAVLGSTGSIGTSCLEVIAAHPSEMTLVGVSAHSSWELLGRQSATFGPRYAVLSDASLEGHVDTSVFDSGGESPALAAAGSTSALTSRGGSGGFEEPQLLHRWPMPDGARSPGDGARRGRSPSPRA